MRQQLPPLAPFAELLRTALGTASRQIAEGSRRNAADAIAARTADRHDTDALAGLTEEANPGALMIAGAGRS
ncbi:MAG: hypothetical protein QOE01_1206 [Actinomycetota bacterium]|jgi:hypothetical protein|nr:hypothetical protein [Actinomycetota bacterium]